jgi:hypothetical protein
MLNKTLLILTTIILTACQQPDVDEPRQERAPDAKPQFNVLRATLNDDDISDVSIFCIDGVKYLAIPGLGMTVKYFNDGENDPYPETCVNK